MALALYARKEAVAEVVAAEASAEELAAVIELLDDPSP